MEAADTLQYYHGKHLDIVCGCRNLHGTCSQFQLVMQLMYINQACDYSSNMASPSHPAVQWAARMLPQSLHTTQEWQSFFNLQSWITHAGYWLIWAILYLSHDKYSLSLNWCSWYHRWWCFNARTYPCGGYKPLLRMQWRIAYSQSRVPILLWHRYLALRWR